MTRVIKARRKPTVHAESLAEGCELARRVQRGVFRWVGEFVRYVDESWLRSRIRSDRRRGVWVVLAGLGTRCVCERVRGAPSRVGCGGTGMARIRCPGLCAAPTVEHRIGHGRHRCTTFRIGGVMV